MVIEGHPFSEGCLRLRTGLPSMQVDAIVSQGAPYTLDEDIVAYAAFPIHLLSGRAFQSNVLRGDIRTPDLRSRSVQAKNVNRDF